MGLFSKKKNMVGEYDVFTIEHWFVMRFLQEELLLNPIKLQRLLYLSYGWYYVLEEKPLFKQPIESFKYGPIVRETYRRFKNYGLNFINAGVPTPKLTKQNLYNSYTKVKKRDAEILEKVFQAFKDHKFLTLSAMCHRKSGAWDRTVKKFGLFHKIPDEYIKDEFILRKFFINNEESINKEESKRILYNEEN
jgi:uncharacterized phage-associated protein